jgi:hypothetical protein
MGPLATPASALRSSAALSLQAIRNRQAMAAYFNIAFENMD